MQLWSKPPGTGAATGPIPIMSVSIMALALCASGTVADAASLPDAPAPAPANFGSAPPGEIPILFNDRTVYSKPDVLKRGRVLAAIVKGTQLYVPLRSMLEQMGATVTASADGKTFTAAKDSASVSVTLGKSMAVIDGESRPLDVPPMLYKGVVLVPVRVLSEALGAYVEWVPGRRVVVVRYISTPVTMPPAMLPTPAPTGPPPVASPVASAKPSLPPSERSHRGFIQAAITAPNNYNEFSAGQFCRKSYSLAAAYPFKHSAFAVKGDYRQDVYVTSDNRTDSVNNQYTQFATIDGGTALTPVFLARQSTFDGRLEYRVAAPQINVGISYLHASTSYGYPQLNAIGFGIEKLPTMRPGIEFGGSVFYYPRANGDYTVANPASSNVGKIYQQQYDIVKYDIGLTLVSEHSPVYLATGFSGDRYTAKQNAPISQTHAGPYLGVGVKL